MRDIETGRAEAEIRERLIDVLISSPLSDTAGTDLAPFRRTADAVMEVVRPLIAEQAEAKLAALRDLRPRTSHGMVRDYVPYSDVRAILDDPARPSMDTVMRDPIDVESERP